MIRGIAILQIQAVISFPIDCRVCGIASLLIVRNIGERIVSLSPQSKMVPKGMTSLLFIGCIRIC